MSANKSKLIAAAQRYAQKGQLKKAIVEYQKALKLEPGDVRTRLKLGEMYHRSGATPEAIDVFLSVAQHYAEQGFLLKAVAVYKQILKIDSNQPDVHILLAQTYQHLGLADAANQYHEAAMLLEKQGRVLDRLHVIRKMLELDPDNAVDRLRLAEAYSAAGKVDEAVTQFRLVCALLKHRGLTDDFLKVGERLLYHRSSDFDVSKDLAQGYLARELPQWALPKLQACFRARPRDTDVLEMLVEAFQQLGQVHKAIAVIKELGHIYEDSGLTREYHEMMGRVLDLNPDDPDAQGALQATRVAPLAAELEFDEADDSAPIDLEASDPDEEPGFGHDEETIAPLPVAAPPSPRPPALRIVREASSAEVALDSSGEALDCDDDIEVIEEFVDGLPFEMDEVAEGGMFRRDSTSSGVDDAEVVSSAPLDVEAAAEDVPFDSDGWEADIDGEGDATLLDAQIRIEDVLAGDRGRDLGLVRPERLAPTAVVAVPDAPTPAAPTPAVPAPAVAGANGAPVAPREPTNGASAAATNDLREELRELDFYLDQGFEPEARTLYHELSERFPQHPELQQRASRVPAEASS